MASQEEAAREPVLYRGTGRFVGAPAADVPAVTSDSPGEFTLNFQNADLREVIAVVLGDLLAAKAVDSGWSGVLLNGMIRDSVDIGTMPIGVKALGTHPLKSVKKGIGERDVPVRFGGVEFIPGAYLYVDEDGILCSPAELPIGDGGAVSM